MKGLIVALGLTSASPLSEAHAQIPEIRTTISVRMVVVGEATKGSTVDMECKPDLPLGGNTHVLLSFDAQGQPTTVTGTAFHIVGDAWVNSQPVHFGEPCTFTEIDTENALSATWTCDYVPAPETSPTENRQGCYDGRLFDPDATPTTAGADAGPFTVYFSAFESEQSANVVFTNRYPDAVTTPTFTG